MLRRPLQRRQRRLRRLLLGLLDAPLDLAHGVEILAHPAAVGGAEPAFEPRHVVDDPVENAGVAAQLGAARVGRAAVAEQPLEQHARVGFGRQRRGRRRPRQVVLVDAGEAVVAVADLRDQVGAELERRDRRAAADLLRGDLIDRDAELVVAAFGALRARAAQKRRAGRGMVAAGDGRVPHLEVGDDASGDRETA